MAVFSDEYDGSSDISDQVTISDSPFVWESGTVVPVWKAAVRHSIRGKEDCYVVPVLSSVRYFASICKDGTLARCDQSLVIAKNVNTGHTSLRIVFSISDDELNCGRMSSDFSGLLVYTDLNGKFRKIEKYAGGEMCDCVYFGESESEIAKERHRLFINRIMEGVTVYKVNYLQMETRCPAPGDTVEYNDSINPSYCNGNCFPDLWWQNPDFDFENDTIAPADTVGIGDYAWPDDNGTGGGGGGGYTGPPTEIGGTESKSGKPKDCSMYYGDTTYYIERYKDYKTRYGENPSIYYISYGKKYCAKFIELRDSGQLSDKGKEWVNKTLLFLQEEMENIIQAYPSLEYNASRLKMAAFKTHPTSYIKGGILSLNMRDKISIMLTIDYGDLMDPMGRQQVMSVCSEQIKYYCSHPSQAYSDAMYLKNNWVTIIKQLSGHILPATRSGMAAEQQQELIELLLGEQINYFYDTIDGFELPGYTR